MVSTSKTSSSAKEGEYLGLPEVFHRYLTGERPVDDVLGHPDFQTEGKRRCRQVTHDADKGRDIFQDTCEHILELDREGPDMCPPNEHKLERGCEGPEMCPTDERAESPRSADISSLEEFLVYFFFSAKNLWRNQQRMVYRRNKKVPIHPTPVEEHQVASNGSSPEVKRQLGEILEQLNELPEKKRLAIQYWLLGYSTRQIQLILLHTGIPCAHVSVQNWIKGWLKKVRGAEVASIRRAS